MLSRDLVLMPKDALRGDDPASRYHCGDNRIGARGWAKTRNASAIEAKHAMPGRSGYYSSAEGRRRILRGNSSDHGKDV
jgi:hypothetical protein